MARGTQLTILIDQLRAAIGHSQNAALGQNFRPGMIVALQKEQERLYRLWDWTHLKIKREVTMAAGSREYAMPSDIEPERAMSAWFREAASIGAGGWKPISYGITLDHYNVSDSGNVSVRNDPVRAWMIVENQIEVWPRPATDGGKLMIEGIKKLGPLTADNHTADLDDGLIVGFVAARMLAKQKDPSASRVLEEAQSLYLRLIGAPVARQQTIIMGGGVDPSEGAYHDWELQV